MKHNRVWLPIAALFAVGLLAGCGGGGTPTPAPEPEPTAYEKAMDAIEMAASAEAAQAAYDAVKEDVTAAQGDRLQMAVNNRIAALELADRIAEQKAALMTAAGMIDTSDLSTQEAVDAARAAINGLRNALDAAADVSDADKAMYQSRLDSAVAAVDTAQGGIDTATRRMNQMDALSMASTALQSALAALTGQTPTEAQLTAANNALTALNSAISDGEDLADSEKASYVSQASNASGLIRVAQAAFDMSQDEAAKAEAARMAALGKAMYAALAGPTPATDNALANIAAPTLSSAGLAIDAAAGAGALADTPDPASVTLTAGDSAGSLGGWMGTHYAHTDTGTKIVNAAVVYTNKGPGKTVSLTTAGINVHTGDTGGDDIKGYYTVDESADVDKIMGAAFTHSATQNHLYDSDSEVAFTTRGTFDGAPGVYRCTGTCSSTNDGKGSPTSLTGTWHFKPDAGAMVHQPDANYLYYGWWVSKDADGDPTAASAFAGTVGTIAALTSGNTPDALAGSATYTGNAAGKFAMNNALDGTGDGGHFTANAALSATFGAGATAGITGTVDNFRLNDGSSDPGWSVELQRAGWDASADTFGATTAGTTVWSINGNKAPVSGAWSGTMYDELPGDPPDGDGSTLPTTVTGTFYSEFSNIGRMVGGFGATKDD